MTDADRSLDELLAKVREAPPNDRIDLRDDVGRVGEPAIEALSDWLSDPELCRFALRAIGRAGQFGEHDAAVRALLGGRDSVPPSVQAEIDLELAKLGYTPPKVRKPSKPSWAKADPYDVAPLPPPAGLSWPGFQAHEFGDVIGTIWRRRDDPASLPPIILRALREIHPHFASWSIYRSAEVHFAITDRYQQFDQRESGWRASKLVVYAHGPTAENPTTVAQAVAGMYIEKGDGSEIPYGPVDARWDWPLFVTSLTDPATAQPLARAMERHSLAVGDFIGQRFGPETQVGGVGRMEDGEFVFRDHQGGERFRGFASLRHHLEALPADSWHDMHIWRSWPKDAAIAAGPAFAAESLVPILEDLARIYVPVVRTAIAEGARALHRVVERRDRSGGVKELVCLIQAHSQDGHFTLPKRVTDELGIPSDGRAQLSVESLEGTSYFDSQLSLRSGTEIYHRTNDPETSGIERVGSKEWIRVTVSNPGGQ